MVDTLSTRSRIPAIIDGLEKDIRRRSLRPGDKYLTAKQAAKIFGVSTISMNRAMQVLARRNLLVRQQRLGTCIGPALKVKSRIAIRQINFFTRRNYQQSRSLPPNDMIDGILSQLPDVDVQFSYLHSGDELSYVRQIVENANEHGILAGVILHLCPREVHQFFHDNDIPTVVDGGTYPHFRLPWVDQDQAQIGRILAEYLIEKGCQRLAFLMRDYWFPGDYRTLDGIVHALADHGRPADALLTRGIPSEKELAREIVKSLLAKEIPPTGIICRSRFLADCAAEAVREMGLKVPDDVVVTLGEFSYMSSPADDNTYPFLKSIDGYSYGCLLGKFLAQRIRGEWPTPDYCETPVTLGLPKENT